jgi:hypothetical protein
MSDKLPYLCPDHPEAEVIHTFDNDNKHSYHCGVCDRELSVEPFELALHATHTVLKVDHTGRKLPRRKPCP